LLDPPADFVPYAGLDIVATHDDSNEFQFWGSEQTRLGIPLTDPRSHFIDARGSTFSAPELRSFRRRSRELNRALDGDQTMVYLRAPPSNGGRSLTSGPR
jgi:hypothetical protein